MAGPRDLVSSPNLFIFIFIGQTFNIWAQDRKIRKHSSEGVFEECGHVVLKLLQAKQPLLSVYMVSWPTSWPHSGHVSSYFTALGTEPSVQWGLASVEWWHRLTFCVSNSKTFVYT